MEKETLIGWLESRERAYEDARYSNSIAESTWVDGYIEVKGVGEIAKILGRIPALDTWKGEKIIFTRHNGYTFFEFVDDCVHSYEYQS